MADDGTKSAGSEGNYEGLPRPPPLSPRAQSVCKCTHELKLRSAGEMGLSGCLGDNSSSVGLGGGDIVS